MMGARIVLGGGLESCFVPCKSPPLFLIELLHDDVVAVAVDVASSPALHFVRDYLNN